MQEPWFVRPEAAERAIHLAPPPRQVTARAFWRVALGTGPQIAWLVTFLLSIFVAGFALDSEAVTAIELRGPMKRTKGTVVRTYETHASENKRSIYGATFSYEADGRELTSTSFGRSVPQPGTTVDVEYLASSPERSRIVGLRRRVFGASAAWPAAAFVIAFAVAIHLSRRGLATARLLRDGRLGYAKLIQTKRTGASVNRQPVIEHVFELDVPLDEVPAAYRAGWQAAVKTHRFSFQTHEGKRLADDPLEPVLFDPSRPGSGYPLDHLEASVTPAGGIDAPGLAAAARFLLPAATVASILIGAYLGFR